VVESAFEPYAYSRARASGLWQFIPGTGSRFGLKQNWWYDGRRDVVESTRAALDYLQYLHDEFNGDWQLAVAAYNCGEAAVARAVRNNIAAGKPIDFWSLKLPAETRAYVPKLIAMKRLVADPEAHGLTFSAIPNQPYFERVWTLGQIDLRVAAEISGLKYEELYELNPAFHRWATDPTGPHFLLVPAETADAFRENVALLSDDQRMKVVRHVVAKGDSVSSVARRYNTTIQVVRELNQLPTGPLTVGTELRVPSEVVTLPPKVLRAAALVDNGGRRNRPHMHVVVRQGDSLWRIARRHGVDVNTLAMMNGMQPGDKLLTGQRLKLNASSDGGSSKASSKSRKVTYTVRSGDTLTRIAKVFQVQVSQLLSWNSLATNAPIVPGQKLMILVTRR
jgi:membrane-bound lytic murein transglycosylase D